MPGTGGGAGSGVVGVCCATPTETESTTSAIQRRVFIWPAAYHSNLRCVKAQAGAERYLNLPFVYTLDTNTILYYLQDEPRAVKNMRAILTDPILPIYVSAVTETELFSFSKLSGAEVEKIENILLSVSRIPLYSQIASAAGYIRKSYG